MGNRIDYVSGQYINNLQFIEEIEKVNNKRYALFKCKCGKTFKARIESVKAKAITSCKCRLGKGGTHKLSHTPLYTTWEGMKQRCYNVKNTAYKWYGERGIKICDEWLIFENFYSWAKDKVKKGLSLDRINVNGNYQPDNCRFVNVKVQANNTRSNLHIEFFGKVYTLAQLSDLCGIGATCLRKRIFKNGWPKSLATTLPGGKNNYTYKYLLDRVEKCKGGYPPYIKYESLCTKIL